MYCRWNSTSGKERLGHLSNAGIRYLRNLLLEIGDPTLIRRAKHSDTANKLLYPKS
jgi:hypothetical protein